MDQPIPEVSTSDVERVVRRDFSVASHADVFRVLDEYGTESYQREKSRVQLAVLKLANGSVAGLRREMDVAKCDYRDVLGPAEYPGYRWDAGKLSESERTKIIEADWKQYRDWLNR